MPALRAVLPTRWTGALALCVSILVGAALGACAKKAPKEPAMTAILASPQNLRARALRDEIGVLFAAATYDAAAEKIAQIPKAIDELLSAMDTLHHKKTAVPDFEVVRYVEAMRDLGENLRGFDRLYSKGNQPALKKGMVQGILELLRAKLR